MIGAAFVEDATTATLERPEAEAEPPASLSSEESASPPEASEAAAQQESATMNALLRGVLPTASDSTSKSDEADADDAATDATDGVSAPAPAGDVKPSALPGRRGAAARIAELEAENARLQKAYDEANPAPPDASEEAKAAIIAREQRFRDLNARPDDDPVFYEGDNYTWLQDEKRRRAVAPELQQHFDTVIERDRQQLREWADKNLESRWNAVKADLSTTLGLPGVTDEVKAHLIQAPLSEQILTHRRLERESLEPELKRLRDENAQLKRERLGSVRTPLGGGRSSPGATYDENTYMNTLLRGGRG